MTDFCRSKFSKLLITGGLARNVLNFGLLGANACFRVGYGFTFASLHSVIRDPRATRLGSLSPYDSRHDRASNEQRAYDQRGWALYGSIPKRGQQAEYERSEANAQGEEDFKSGMSLQLFLQHRDSFIGFEVTFHKPCKRFAFGLRGLQFLENQFLYTWIQQFSFPKFPRDIPERFAFSCRGSDCEHPRYLCGCR